MDGQGYGDYLNSGRDVSGFELRMMLAKSKVEAAEIRQWYELSEFDFLEGFPALAEKVKELPDDTPTV